MGWDGNGGVEKVIEALTLANIPGLSKQCQRPYHVLGSPPALKSGLHYSSNRCCEGKGWEGALGMEGNGSAGASDVDWMISSRSRCKARSGQAPQHGGLSGPVLRCDDNGFGDFFHLESAFC